MMCFDLALNVDWTIVTGIGTIIMALASFIGVVFSYKSTRESQRMWEEDNRPRVIFTVVISDNKYYLKVGNIGKQVAYNINLKVNEEFIEQFPNLKIREYFKKLCNKTIHLEPGKPIYYLISFTEGHAEKHPTDGDIAEGPKMKELIEKLADEQIVISGSYNDKYNINESFTMSQYTGSFAISDPTISKRDEIGKSLSKLEEVSKSLNKIYHIKKRL